MRSLSFVLFFAVALAIDGALHWFLWVRLVLDPGWPRGLERVLTAVVIGLAIGVPVGMVAARFAPRVLAEPIATGIFVWMGALFIMVSVLIAAEVLRWAVIGGAAAYAKLGGGGDSVDLARREMLSRSVAVAATVATGGLSTAALRSGLADVETHEVAVRLPRLPPALSGLTLVQLSDVHVGPLIGRRFVDTIVDRANALSPDAVVITGDLVDGDVARLREHTAALARLRARWGVYFVTGNHEYYSGVEGWLAELQRLGVRVLRNERVTLGDSAASIDLAGVDDSSADRFGFGHGADLERAVRGRDAERELVLLAHQPKAIADAARHGVGLQLSGHTHGGQIWPFNHVVGLVQPYVAGLHQHTDLTQIYVSRGTGFWGPPMRLNAPAEITKVVLSPG